MSGGFQPQGFQPHPGFQQNAEIVAEITSILPALTQEMLVFTPVEEAGGPGGGGVFLAPGFIEHAVAKAKIQSVLPALTTSITVDVNDDELVLLLALV